MTRLISLENLALNAVKQTVLVVAPQFPAINQPWIETYIESLIVEGFDIAIYSGVKAPSKTSRKVKQLGLLEKTTAFHIDSKRDRIRLFPQIMKLGSKHLLAAIGAARKLSTTFKDSITGLFNGLCLSALFQEDISVVHSHDESLAYTFLFFAKSKNLPLVLTFHGLPPHGVNQLNSQKRHILYSNVNRVIVNTKFAKRQICALGCPPEKVAILPQGLPLQDFPFGQRPAPQSDEAVKLLTVGRYHRDKGQIYALIALRRLLNSGVNAEWNFVGVGPDLVRLQAWSKKLKLNSNVKFHTELNVTDLKSLYRNCHLFVLPSVESSNGHVETQGVVLQEAQASGCIPIASKTGGIPECLHDQTDALLVRQRSSRQIADAIASLINSPSRWETMQLQGRKNVENNLSASVIGKKMQRLLRSTFES